MTTSLLSHPELDKISRKGLDFSVQNHKIALEQKHALSPCLHSMVMLTVLEEKSHF